MGPREALHSPVVHFYLALIFGLLLGGGLLLVLLRQTAGPAWQSFRGWLFIVPITAAAILLGREMTILFFTAVGALGLKEFARATGLSRDALLTAAVYLGILAAEAVPLACGGRDLFLVLPLFVLATILVVPIVRNRVEGQLRALSLAVLGFLYFGWMFGHVALFANTKHAYAYLGYLLFAVEISDVSAFLTGKLFGRHPLRSNISPKKTWEGALGALFVSLALPWALWFTFPHLGPIDLLAAGLIVGVGGQVGDLAMSVIKRDLGMKDLGAIIPGHGGIVDRIDSLIYVAPLLYHYLWYRHHLEPP